MNIIAVIASLYVPQCEACVTKMLQTSGLKPCEAMKQEGTFNWPGKGTYTTYFLIKFSILQKIWLKILGLFSLIIQKSLGKFWQTSLF